MLFRSNDTATTEIYTLSLHDALPISCSICGFSFREKYGEIGENFIHVHHLKPLSEIRTDYQLDPIKDLRPVCPNCHEMLHRKEPAYSLEELINIIKENTSDD